MSARPPRIMLVERDPVLVELIVSSLTRRLRAHVTCLADASQCIDTELLEPHDLTILDLDRDHETALRLVAELQALSTRPVVLLMNKPSGETVIEAMHLNAKSVFDKPFEIADLMDVVENAVRDRAIQRARSAKYARMRDMVRRVLRERRDLNHRMELVCRDLVGAQRRLVHRVLTLEEQMVDGSTSRET
jgi:DNA-binding NtrC family response regulator